MESHTNQIVLCITIMPFSLGTFCWDIYILGPLSGET